VVTSPIEPIKQAGFTTEVVQPTTTSTNVLAGKPAVAPTTEIVADKPAFAKATAGKPEDELQKRIAEMEIVEKQKVDDHKQKMAIEAEENAKIEAEKKKIQGTLGGFGSLPKYQDLFVNKNKLPPLPPLPKFEPSKNIIINNQVPSALPQGDVQKVASNNQLPTPNDQTENKPQFKTEVIPASETNTSKPTFVNIPKEEVKIPQPPQLAKKTMPVFQEKSQILNSKSEIDDGEKKQIDIQDNVTNPAAAKAPADKMDYDKLFGNV
jgi:hypothetical protein